MNVVVQGLMFPVQEDGLGLHFRIKCAQTHLGLRANAQMQSCGSALQLYSLNRAKNFLTCGHDEIPDHMPTLNWYKREEAVRAATRAPYRLLEPVAELSYGDADSENLLIHRAVCPAGEALTGIPSKYQ